MKKYIALLVVVFVLLSAFTMHRFYTHPDYEPIVFPKGKEYQSEWQKIDSLERQGLPKSALESVRVIYKDAKKHHNIPQVVKALIYDIKIVNYSEENGLIKAIERVETEIKTAQTPIKQILYSLNAELYFKYYQKNSWKIHERTAVTDEPSTDIATWDVAQIHAKIIQDYQLSLSDANTLQRISLETIKPILLNTEYSRKYANPSLYDFIAERAVYAFSHQSLDLTKPIGSFSVDNKDYWSDAKDFVDLSIPTTDTTSLKWNALKILQSWLAFRLEMENPSALLITDLYRLETIYHLSGGMSKEDEYIKALEGLEKQFSTLPEVAYVQINLAEQLHQKARKWRSDVAQKTQFDKFNKACIEHIKSIKQASLKDSILTQKCNYLMHQIERPNLSFKTEEVLLPNQAFPIQLKIANINKVKCSVFKISPEKKTAYMRLYGQELYNEIKKNELVLSSEIALENLNDYQSHTTDYIVSPLNVGQYALLLQTETPEGEKLADVAYIQVSNLALLQKSNENKVEAQILHRRTGKAIAGATVNIYEKTYRYREGKEKKSLIKTLKSDKNGYVSAQISGRKDLAFEVLYKGDIFESENRLYVHQKSHSSPRKQTYLFTDRSIYRPGQTVYFKAILLEKNQKKHQIVPYTNLTVDLMDANYQKISSLNLKTNDYGSVSGSFVLPQNLLNGRMTLKTKYGNQQISVEAYKRPKFEVKVDDFKESFRLNDVITVKGIAKAFAGYAIAEAEVKYRVIRKPNYIWRWYAPISADAEIANGTAKTNEQGQFEFNFKALAEENTDDKAIYTYQIEVDVTDISGETHSTISQVNVGKQALILEAELSEYLSVNKLDSISIKALNLEGEAIPADVSVELFEMQSGNTLKHDLYWETSNSKRISKKEWVKLLPNYQYQKLEAKQGKRLFKAQLNTQQSTYLTGLKSQGLKQGMYGLKLTTTDKFGEKVETFKTFVLYDADAKSLPITEKMLFLPLNKDLEPEQNARILLGTSFKKQTLILEIEKSNGSKELRHIHLSNEQKVIEIPVNETDRGGFKVSLNMVKNNRSYQKSVRFNVPFSNRKLNITFETFRDKLYPGQKEEWRLKIKGHQGEKIASEFLAGMYDVSLDKIKPHAWNFDIIQSFINIQTFDAQGFYAFSGRGILRNNERIHGAVFVQPQLNWFGFSPYGLYTRDMCGGLVRNMAYANMSSAKPKALEINETEPEADISTKEMIDDKNTSGIKTKQAVRQGVRKLKVRQNFDETAFFYPQLKTDDEGNVVLSFTMPESLTKWHFMGLAYSKDLKYGLVERELMTQKDLMVETNVPRFVREGDDLYLSVKLVNLTEQTIQARTNIQFYDALSGKNLTRNIIADAYQKSTEILPKASGLIKVHLKIPTDISAIRYKVVSSTNAHADGEEHIIPVLTNRVLVTETMPMPIRGKTDKTFKLNKLLNNTSNSLSYYAYTLEMTSNPAWYAVQALPYLSEPKNDCAEQIFSAYYANTLASHIANANPKIKSVFEAWKNEEDGDAFLSNLEKNKELKSIILEASPWVREAKSESEQKRRIANLFNLNQLSYDRNSNLKRLKEMQMSNGAWAWFKGMPEDRYLTQLIVLGFAKLKQLKVTDLEQTYPVNQMLGNAIAYLDTKIAEDYQRLLKNHTEKDLNKKSYTSAIQIQYLWMRSYFKAFAIPKESKKAVAYFKRNSQTFWTKHNRYLQTMIALTALQNKDSNSSVADKVLKSLKEFAIHNEEMGMYWKESYGTAWSQAPVEQQALTIAFFKAMGEEVEPLKVWLLKQKQTQDWQTSRATTDAVYALLLQGDDWLKNTEQVEVKVAGKSVNFTENTKPQAGTGYVKKIWSGDEINAQMGKVQVKKATKGVAWGAVYLQYFEDMDKVDDSQSGLKIEKQWMIERTNRSGKVLEPLSKTSLKVGDKLVVRMVVKTDRNLEYVHLKDMHASGLEPLNTLSGYTWASGVGYYQSNQDASTNFFFSYLPKGTYVFEYPLRAIHSGDFSDGFAQIQCMYAPEFAAHSKSIRLKIEE